MKRNNNIPALAINLTFITLTSISTSFAQWVKKADAFKTRSEVTSAVYNSKLYTFLGFSNAALETEPSSEVYDPVANKWTLLGSITANVSMTHQGVVLIDNTVWHIGGRVGTNPGALTSAIWIYNITSNSWAPGPQLLDPATGKPLLWAAGGAALLGRTLHIFGGFVINACDNDQDKYHLTLDVDTWLSNPTKPAQWVNTLAPLPVKRNHFGTVVLGGKIYAIGGQFGHDCGGGLDQQRSHVYDPSTNTWTELPLLPAPRSHVEGGTFAIDGKIYVVAGQGTDGASTKKVTIFDPAANNGVGQWKDDTTLTLPKAYEGVSAKVINNTFIYSHGGEGSSAGTRKETYTRPIVRNPVYKFGFTADCINLNALSGNSVTAKTLLFTIDGSRSYSLSSNATWLTISKNSTGTASPNAVDIGITANAASLAPGNYSATVTASGTGSGQSYTQASFCINLKVAIRINGGGPAITVKDIQWAGCSATGSCNSYVKGGFAYTEKSLPAITGFSSELSQAIFQTEWTGGQNGANPVAVGAVAFSYNIPVKNGKYIIRLHFAELNKNGAGLRKFDVNIEGGAKELVNFDIFSVAGGMYKAIYRDFPVNISDGMINIDFIRQVENAKISAIEILPDNSSSTTNLEAESAILSGAKAANNQTGFTGTGFADYINSSGDYIQWNVNQPAAASALLVFRYANGGTSNRPLKLEVNGALISSSLSFPSTGSWSSWVTERVTVNLIAGTNTIRLTSIGYNGPNVDNLALSSSTPLQSFELVQSGQQSIGPNEFSMEQPGFFKVNVSPNPSSGTIKITVTSSSRLPAIIELRNILGQNYQRLNFPGNNTNTFALPVKNLAAGIYIVTVTQGTNKAYTKIVVEKN